MKNNDNLVSCQFPPQQAMLVLAVLESWGVIVESACPDHPLLVTVGAGLDQVATELRVGLAMWHVRQANKNGETI